MRPGYLENRFRGRYFMARGWMEDPIFKGEPYTRAQAYEWLVGNAVYKAGIFDLQGNIVRLERGQLSYSLRYLEPIWGWEKGKISRFLKKLDRAGYIRLETKTKSATEQNIITICNYNEIQGSDGFDATTNDTAARQRCDGIATNKKKENKDKKENNNPDHWRSALEKAVGSVAYRSDFEGIAYKDGLLTVRTDRQCAQIKRNHLEAIFSVFGGDVRIDSLMR